MTTVTQISIDQFSRDWLAIVNAIIKVIVLEVYDFISNQKILENTQ